MRTRHSRNCSEAGAALCEPEPPGLVLTGTSLPDGTWIDVLKAASAAPVCVPVIVISSLLDIRLYLDVLESGAHDFIVPPINSGDMKHIIAFCYNDGRVVRWVLKQAVRGFQSVTGSFS